MWPSTNGIGTYHVTTAICTYTEATVEFTLLRLHTFKSTYDEN
jgi:hypothetical protein